MTSTGIEAALLPHQYPFRFVEEILAYVPGEKLTASFCPQALQQAFGGLPYYPAVCLIEGLAQVAVLLTQAETKPLAEGEVPLLGSVQSEVRRRVGWEETLTYDVRAVRFLEKRAVLQGVLYGDAGDVIAEAVLGVAIARGGAADADLQSVQPV